MTKTPREPPEPPIPGLTVLPATGGPIALLNAAELLRRPNAPVVIVEEHCAALARELLTPYVVVSWSGAALMEECDWTALRGRSVICWPRAHKDSIETMTALASVWLKGIAKTRRLLDVAAQPAHWDISIAHDQGMDFGAIHAFLAQHLVEVKSSKERAAEAASFDAAMDAPHEDESGPSAVVTVAQMGLDENNGGVPQPTMANVSKIIQRHPTLRGKISYDSFTQKKYNKLNNKTGAIQQMDAQTRGNILYLLQDQLKLNKFTKDVVNQGIDHAAFLNQSNSLTAWLDSLKWDGIKRLDDLLPDCLGAEKNEYTMAVGNNFLIGMVARAYDPGCQVDSMPVFEGLSGIAKSSFLRVLVTGHAKPGDIEWSWFTTLGQSFGDREFSQAMQGKLLVELGDLASFNTKSSWEHMLQFTSARDDEYRKPYDVDSQGHPRVAIFAATTEKNEYLRDGEGKRRFWPVPCTEVNLDLTFQMRPQFYAEAVVLYKAGTSHYVMPQPITHEMQLSRIMSDPWTKRILGKAETLWSQNIPVTSEQLLLEAIEMPLKDQHDGHKRRVKTIMTKHHWVQKRTGAREYKKVVR